MRERDKGRFPDWAETERAGDLAWIKENLHVFWPAAQREYEEFGRGAIVVDTTQRPTGEGHPFGYFPQGMVEQTGDEDAQRMVTEYDPAWEMVTVLLKTDNRVSVYRVGVISRPKGGGGDMVLSMTREFEGYIVQPEDVLTEREHQLLDRAQAGEISCPWCERPLMGTFYFYLDDGYQDKGVRLRCSSCGFDER